MLKSLQTIWSRFAIALLLGFLGCGLYVTPVQAATVATSDGAYRDGVQSMYAQVNADPTTPTNRAFKDVLDQLFKPAAVQIPFRFVTETGKGRSVNYAGNIYFSAGAIFINYDGDAVDEERFATIADKLYIWKPSAAEGQILKRFPGDTLAFVMYMVDPAAIMRSIYSEYLAKPQDFTTVTATGGSKSLLFKKVQSGFKGIRIQPQPFWLKAFLLEAAKDQGMSVGSLEIDAPIGLAQLPPELTILPTGIKFKPSDNSLKERMTYL